MEWKNIFANHILDKKLIFKIYEELLQFKNNKKKITQIEKEKDLNRHSSENYNEWPTTTQTDVQHQ